VKPIANDLVSSSSLSWWFNNDNYILHIACASVSVFIITSAGAGAVVVGINVQYR